MTALSPPRVDQNSVSVSPGEINSGGLDVKNSMRGALGLGVGVGVGASGRGVRVGPNSGVGDGPPVGVMGAGVFDGVGETLRAGVGVRVNVEVGVMVGCSVGNTCCTVAPHALNASAITITMNSRRVIVRRCKSTLYTGLL